MSIPHRLNAGNRFERPETQSIKRVVFLSVEGEVTERRYFEFVRESRETLGIKSVVEIHVLRRGDSSSSPEKVVELLENYLEVRNNNDFLAEVDKLELKHYDKEFIHKYLEAPDTIDVKEKRQFEGFLKEEQLDLTYSKDLITEKTTFSELLLIVMPEITVQRTWQGFSMNVTRKGIDAFLQIQDLSFGCCFMLQM